MSQPNFPDGIVIHSNEDFGYIVAVSFTRPDGSHHAEVGIECRPRMLDITLNRVRCYRHIITILSGDLAR